MLIHLGADKEVATPTGQRALHLAAFHGHLEVVKFLLEVGAEKEARTQNGANALHLAAFRLSLESHRQVAAGCWSWPEKCHAEWL